MDDGFKEYLKALNLHHKGSIIYTGNPEFNERYLSKRRTLRFLLAGKLLKPLATREQELEIQADFYKNLTNAFLPKILAYYKNKKIRRANASAPRLKTRTGELKPSKDELIISREKYYFTHGTYHGWIKATRRHFDICDKTINKIKK